MFEIKALVQDMLSLIDFEIHIDHRKLLFFQPCCLRMGLLNEVFRSAHLG
jgi:hypothetical protein